jgi:hypothetical protein
MGFLALIVVMVLVAPAIAGVVGCWHFDELNPPPVITPDASGQNNFGTLTPFTTSSEIPALTEGMFGKALTLTGSNGFVSVVDSSSLDVDFATIEGWIKLNQIPLAGTTMSILRKGPYNDRVYGLDIQPGGKLRGFVVLGTTSGPALIKQGGISLTIGQWYHVAMTYDGTDVEVYVNGIPDGAPVAATPDVISDNNQPVTIGGQLPTLSGGSLAFKGQIDELRIWNNALTQAQIQALNLTCQGFLPPFDKPLTLKKKDNRAIPVKLMLVDMAGNYITDAELTAPPIVSVSYSSGSGSSTLVVDIDLLPAGLSTDGNQFRYDPYEGIWIINLATKPFTASGEYKVTVKAGDNTYLVISCEQTFTRLN